MIVDDLPIMKAILLGLGFSLLAQVLTVLISLVIGGFRVGFLPISLEIAMKSKEELDAFIDMVEERLVMLGVQATDREQEYRQSGQIAGDFSSFTHAKTPKLLSYDIEEVSGGYNVIFFFKYTDLIVADTGESAFRDALLDYITKGRLQFLLKCVRNLGYFELLQLAFFASP